MQPPTLTSVSLCSYTPLLSTNLFDLEKAQTSAGWLQELAADGKHTPETEEYGISSIVYRRRKPFHPQKLYAAILDMGKTDLTRRSYSSSVDTSTGDQNPLRPVIRSKGLVWLANACAYRIMWHSAGTHLKLDPSQPFDAAIKEAGGEPEQIEPGPIWDPIWGDRETELVLIGLHLDKTAVVAKLDSCLVSDEEFQKATADKKHFESFVEEYERANGSDASAFANIFVDFPDADALRAATGGLASAFEGWMALEDPFFGGDAADRFMLMESHDTDETSEDGGCGSSSDEEDSEEEEADQN